MRIAIVGSRGIPAGTGGVERVVEELAGRLASGGHEVLVYSRPWYTRARAAGPPPGVRVLTTGGLPGKRLDTLTHTATAMWDVLRRKVDVVHVFSPAPALLSFVPAAARLPIALTIQGPDWQAERWSGLGRKTLGAGLACGMRWASAISAVSLSLRDFLADTYGREVTYIPNGVRPAPARQRGPEAVAEVGLRQGGYALYVGRIVPGKGVDLLVRAWRMLAAPMPLVIVGEAYGEEAYAARCARLADRSVRFLGPRFGELLDGLYANAAVVIQPSRAEGMSLVLLEAAAHGRCVVAREMPANREVLGEAMVAFSGDSPEDLAAAIRKCLGDSGMRRRLGWAARRRVAERFRWGPIVAQYERLYRCALETRQRT